MYAEGVVFAGHEIMTVSPAIPGRSADLPIVPTRYAPCTLRVQVDIPYLCVIVCYIYLDSHCVAWVFVEFICDGG